MKKSKIKIGQLYMDEFEINIFCVCGFEGTRVKIVDIRLPEESFLLEENYFRELVEEYDPNKKFKFVGLDDT